MTPQDTTRHTLITLALFATALLPAHLYSTQCARHSTVCVSPCVCLRVYPPPRRRNVERRPPALCCLLLRVSDFTPDTHNEGQNTVYTVAGKHQGRVSERERRNEQTGHAMPHVVSCVIASYRTVSRRGAPTHDAPRAQHTARNEYLISFVVSPRSYISQKPRRRPQHSVSVFVYFPT